MNDPLALHGVGAPISSGEGRPVLSKVAQAYRERSSSPEDRAARGIPSPRKAKEGDRTIGSLPIIPRDTLRLQKNGPVHEQPASGSAHTYVKGKRRKKSRSRSPSTKKKEKHPPLHTIFPLWDREKHKRRPNQQDEEPKKVREPKLMYQPRQPCNMKQVMDARSVGEMGRILGNGSIAHRVVQSVCKAENIDEQREKIRNNAAEQAEKKSTEEDPFDSEDITMTMQLDRRRRHTQEVERKMHSQQVHKAIPRIPSLSTLLSNVGFDPDFVGSLKKKSTPEPREEEMTRSQKNKTIFGTSAFGKDLEKATQALRPEEGKAGIRTLGSVDAGEGSGTVSKDGSQKVTSTGMQQMISSKLSLKARHSVEENKPVAAPVTITTFGQLEFALEEHGKIDTKLYGQGNAKTLNELMGELERGECQLKMQAGHLFRWVEVLTIDFRCGNKVLVETHQQLPDGRMRARNLGLGEKKLSHERWRTAAARCFRKKLGVRLEEVAKSIRFDSKSFVRASRRESSKSYPGLVTHYEGICINATVTQAEAFPALGLPHGHSFTSESEGPRGKTTFFWSWWSLSAWDAVQATKFGGHYGDFGVSDTIRAMDEALEGLATAAEYKWILQHEFSHCAGLSLEVLTNDILDGTLHLKVCPQGQDGLYMSPVLVKLSMKRSPEQLKHEMVQAKVVHDVIGSNAARFFGGEVVHPEGTCSAVSMELQNCCWQVPELVSGGPKLVSTLRDSLLRVFMLVATGEDASDESEDLGVVLGEAISGPGGILWKMLLACSHRASKDVFHEYKIVEAIDQFALARTILGNETVEQCLGDYMLTVDTGRFDERKEVFREIRAEYWAFQRELDSQPKIRQVWRPWLCLGHGNLNAHNVILDTYLSAWLMNFSNAGELPVLYDFAHLFTSMLFECLSLPVDVYTLRDLVLETDLNGEAISQWLGFERYASHKLVEELETFEDGDDLLNMLCHVSDFCNTDAGGEEFLQRAGKMVLSSTEKCKPAFQQALLLSEYLIHELMSSWSEIFAKKRSSTLGRIPTQNFSKSKESDASQEAAQDGSEGKRSPSPEDFVKVREAITSAKEDAEQREALESTIQDLASNHEGLSNLLQQHGWNHGEEGWEFEVWLQSDLTHLLEELDGDHESGEEELPGVEAEATPEKTKKKELTGVFKAAFELFAPMFDRVTRGLKEVLQVHRDNNELVLPVDSEKVMILLPLLDCALRSLPNKAIAPWQRMWLYRHSIMLAEALHSQLLRINSANMSVLLEVMRGEKRSSVGGKGKRRRRSVEPGSMDALFGNEEVVEPLPGDRPLDYRAGDMISIQLSPGNWFEAEVLNSIAQAEKDPVLNVIAQAEKSPKSEEKKSEKRSGSKTASAKTDAKVDPKVAVPSEPSVEEPSVHLDGPLGDSTDFEVLLSYGAPLAAYSTEGVRRKLAFEVEIETELRQRATLENVGPGTAVQRGPDWQWDEEDALPEDTDVHELGAAPGHVHEVDKSRNKCSVKWANGFISDCHYRLGPSGRHDLDLFLTGVKRLYRGKHVDGPVQFSLAFDGTQVTLGDVVFGPRDVRRAVAERYAQYSTGVAVEKEPNYGDASFVNDIQMTKVHGQGLAVATVAPGGPADLAGVKVGDILLHVEGPRMNSPLTNKFFLSKQLKQNDPKRKEEAERYHSAAFLEDVPLPITLTFSGPLEDRWRLVRIDDQAPSIFVPLFARNTDPVLKNGQKLIIQGPMCVTTLNRLNHAKLRLKSRRFKKIQQLYEQSLLAAMPHSLNHITAQPRNMLVDLAQPELVCAKATDHVEGESGWDRLTSMTKWRDRTGFGASHRTSVKHCPCYLILGGAASGKTTLAQQLVLYCIREPNDLVPLVVSTTNWDRLIREDIELEQVPNTLHVRVGEEDTLDLYLRKTFFEGTDRYEMTRQALESRRLLLIIDGLHNAESEKTMEQIIGHLIRLQNSGHSVVVTSRPGVPQLQRLMEDFIVLEVKPMTEATRLKVERNRLGESRAKYQAFCNLLQGQEAFLDHPMVHDMFLCHFQQFGYSGDKKQWVYTVFQEVAHAAGMRLLLTEVDRNSAMAEPGVEIIRRILAIVAAFCLDKKEAGVAADFGRAEVDEAIKHQNESVDEGVKNRASKVINEADLEDAWRRICCGAETNLLPMLSVARRDPAPNPETNPAPRLVFAHPGFALYYGTVYLLELMEGKILPELEDMLFVTKWRPLLDFFFLAAPQNACSLELKGRQLGDSEAQTLSEFLCASQAICACDLSQNCIGAGGARSIGTALKINTSLRELIMSSNLIGFEGAKYIASGLQQNAVLEKIDLAANDFGDLGAVYFASSLGANQTLTSLDLRGNRISEEGAEDLRDGLKRNKHLMHLEIGSNPNTKSGVEGVEEVRVVAQVVKSEERARVWTFLKKPKAQRGRVKK